MRTINKEITKTNIHSLHTTVFYVLVLILAKKTYFHSERRFSMREK